MLPFCAYVALITCLNCLVPKHSPHVLHAGSFLLVANYVAAIVLAFRMPHAFRVPLMAGAHAALAIAVIQQTRQLESHNHTLPAIRTYYQFIWNIFYTEYCLLPFL